jgi:glucose/arabinose dehydrogenase/PKD repeat protein
MFRRSQGRDTSRSFSSRIGVRSLAPLLAVLAVVSPARAITLPANFISENATPGTSFDTPTGIAFLPDGRMLVCEKKGRLLLVTNGVVQGTPVWSSLNEVLDQNDRGLLDVAVDPQFATNHRIYLLYTVEPDSNGVDTDNDAFGRLTRYELTTGNPMQTIASSRAILMGVDWPRGPLSASPSHTIGRLQFASDGSLLVSIGDGASYTLTDDGGNDAPAFGAGRTDPNEDIGAFRAQYLSSLCGKVLRINPANGQGYPSNPWYDGNPSSVPSRVWEYGLRNPYRFVIRPGTGATNPSTGDPGTLYIGDVGYTLWEEISVAKVSGKNFGWPCYEGFSSNSSYQAAEPLHHDCTTLGTPTNPAPHTPPLMSWHHTDPALSQPPGIRGNAIAGVEFYTGTRYPALYRGQLFFADYGRNWIKVARVDANDNLLSVVDFADDAEGPVGMVADPIDGDLHYVSINTGEVRRIRWTGSTGNSAPIANATGTPLVGVYPLAVSFSSAGTTDPDGDPITTSWSFGDATGSTAANPSHTYMQPGIYDAVLMVADTAGGVARDTVTVMALASGAFPTTAVLDNFNRPDGPVGGSWVGTTSGLVISGQDLTQPSGSPSAVWGGQAFGQNQEAYIRFDAVTLIAPEHDLMLKVQGLSWDLGHIEVRWDATYPRIAVGSYTPGIGWRGHGTFTGVTFGVGDQLGARAFSNGIVQVLKNGTVVGTCSVTDWPFYRQGGYLGLTLSGATASRLDDFGGGNTVISSNTPPVAVIEQPADGSFYVINEPIQLQGRGDDSQTAASDLAYEWKVELLHNNHAHPSLTASTRNASFVTESHEDGTGTRYRISLEVTDPGALKDTTSITIWPEVDLTPTLAATGPWNSGSNTTLQFKLHNKGRVISRRFHWTAMASALLLAEGDTTIAPLDSITITRSVKVLLPAATHALRVVADTLGEVVETNEGNNAAVRPLVVNDGNVAVDNSPRGWALSAARPNPTRDAALLDLALPHPERVSFEVFDVAGRVIWSQSRSYPAGVWVLTWPGTDQAGRPVAPGLYLAGVETSSNSQMRRVFVVR